MSNPRMLKEVEFYSRENQVEVIKIDLGGWTSQLEEEVEARLPSINIHRIPWPHKKSIAGLSLHILHICCQLLSVFTPNILIRSMASDKRTFLLNQTLKRIQVSHDVVIAHSIAALSACFYHTNRPKIPLVFDLEDYHPGEIIGSRPIIERKRREWLLKKMLPHLHRLFIASPHYQQPLEQLVTDLPSMTYIKNSFSASNFQLPNNRPEGKLKFVWFSQNITSGRGLELTLNAMSNFAENIEVTLIGNLHAAFHENVLKRYNFVRIQQAMEPSALYAHLIRYDVGLAMEEQQVDLNKDLCVSNKLFAYYQAGLYILATRTTGQQAFLSDRQCGKLTEYDVDAICRSISDMLTSVEDIRNGRKERYTAAVSDAWEQEFNKYQSVLSNE